MVLCLWPGQGGGGGGAPALAPVLALTQNLLLRKRFA